MPDGAEVAGANGARSWRWSRPWPRKLRDDRADLVCRLLPRGVPGDPVAQGPSRDTVLSGIGWRVTGELSYSPRLKHLKVVPTEIQFLTFEETDRFIQAAAPEWKPFVAPP